MPAKAWTEVSVRHVLCVVGGARAGDGTGGESWTPVRVEDVDGKTAFSVSSREAWLSNHVFGKHTKEQHMVLAIQAVVETMRRQLDRPSASGVSARAEPPKPKGARKLGVGLSDPASPPRPMKSRRRSCQSPAASVSPGRNAPSSGKKGRAHDFSDCVIEGVEVQAKIKAGRGLWVVAKPEAVAATIAAVRASSLALSSASASSASDAYMGGSDEDSGRIAWHFAKQTWQVSYDATGQGEMRKSIAGLQVATHDANGAALSASQYQQARLQLLKKARMLWNTLDKTESPRFCDAA